MFLKTTSQRLAGGSGAIRRSAKIHRSLLCSAATRTTQSSINDNNYFGQYRRHLTTSNNGSSTDYFQRAFNAPPSCTTPSSRYFSQTTEVNDKKTASEDDTVDKDVLSSKSSSDSSSSATTTTAATTNPTPIIVKFPWFHSKHTKPRIELELLTKHQKLSSVRGKLAQFVWQASTAYSVGLPLSECVLGQNAWKEEITENGAWAFASGMGAMWSNIFQVPMDDVVSVDEDGDIALNFVYNTTIHSDSNDAAVETDGAKATATQDSSHGDDEKSEHTNPLPAVATDDQVKELFGKDLVKVYKRFHDKIKQSASSSSSSSLPPNNLEIKLQMRPVHYEMIKIGCLPFLSRAILEEKPSFRKEYFDMMIILRTHGFKVFLDHWNEFANRTADERGLFMETTVTADILVDCVESFQVRDISSGNAPQPLVQGDGVERTVRHLVRMELDFAAEFLDEDDENNSTGDDLRWFKSNWKIVDVDDLMDTKGEWFIPMPTNTTKGKQ